MADNEAGEEKSFKMTDNVEGEESTARGNDWEVVSLSASAYAAAPGPAGVELNNEDKSDYFGEQAETSHALFLSGHFAFPPNQHENLPLESDRSAIHNEHVDKDVEAEIGIEEGGRSGGKEDDSALTLKGLNDTDEFAGTQCVKEKDSMLSIGCTEFEETSADKEQSIYEETSADKEQSIYDAAKFSFGSETDLGSSTQYDDNTIHPGLIAPSEQGLDSSGDVFQSPRSLKDDKFDVPDLPCGAWWKRRASSLYSHAKEANALWSVFVAAAVMGLVLLGQRWQHERWQALQQKWQLSVNDQKTGRMLGPIYRLKTVIVGSHPRGSFLRGSSSGDS